MSEQIIVLSNREQARERINVFHGSSNNWINMVKELIGNSKDIFKKNTSTNNLIQIIIHDSNKIEYTDNATGIPVEGIASDGSPNYVAIFEKPFAGSNYANEFDTVGQNGIFLWTLSMTCKNIEYYIGRPNRNIYNIAYKKGEISKKMSIIGKTDTTYSKMIFELDEDIWEKPNFTFDDISEIAKNQACMGNLTITIKDIKNNKEVSYRYENGLSDYFDEITTHKSKVTDNITINSSKASNISVRGKMVNEVFSTNIIFSYSNDSLDDVKKEFLNTADLIQYGTIQDGMILGLKNSIHKWLRDNNKYQKNEKGISNEDISIGLNYVSNNTSLYVEYENQTKVKTSTLRYRDVMKSIIEEYMEIFFIENKLQTETLCNQILINKRSREKSEQARLDIRKKLEGAKKGGLSVKIEGLKHCDMRKSTLEERILILDEGISANSTIIDSFDGRIMGAYGLRGRFINSLKAKVIDVLNNVPAKGIIDALGCGIEIPKEEKKHFKDVKTFEKNDLKYGSVGILCDADAFGKGIGLSLITFFYKFMPTLLKEGRIYLVISPRYQIETKKGISHYAYNETEKNEIIKKIGEKNIDNITIRKGLGEFNKDEFWDLVLSPTAREKTFIKIDYIEKEEEMIEFYFNALMGEDITNRKKFIKENIVNVNLEELE